MGWSLKNLFSKRFSSFLKTMKKIIKLFTMLLLTVFFNTAFW